LKDKGVIDSGCSRHMTGNRSYLTDYEEINGGIIAFRGNSKGGKITRKGKIRTGKLDVEYFLERIEEGEVQVSTADMEINIASTSVNTVSVNITTAEPITTAIV
ncbi:hypothetical protein Tco_1223655, partial [Tanacetum coccineum]